MKILIFADIPHLNSPLCDLDISVNTSALGSNKQETDWVINTPYHAMCSDSFGPVEDGWYLSILHQLVSLWWTQAFRPDK